MTRLKHLFEPIRIGPMDVDNRIVMSAMGVGFGTDENGSPTDQLIEFIAERARGRPGMIISGSAYVHPSGRTNDILPMKMLYVWDDVVLPGLERMVKAVHRHDVRFGAQLVHGGLTMLPDPAFSASAIPKLTARGLKIKEPTKDDLQEFVDAFASAAERCVKAGFDFLEVHGAHGYLIETFLTPYYNQRTDEYGGSFDNRIRFLLEIVREIKMRIGDSTPLGLKLSGDDFIPEGAWGMDDLCRLAPILEREGISYLNITCGASNYGQQSQAAMVAPMYVDQGDRVRFGEKLKKHVAIPVITVGRVKNPVMANAIIREGKADMVAMARAFVADPELVQKARRGDVADIKPCLADCLGCIEHINRYGYCSCTVNARVGREYQLPEIEGDKTPEAKMVLIAGAGPAGMEAARRAAFAGHKVVLCDTRSWMGGQLKIAASMPGRSEIGDILPWYERQLNKLGVGVRLNTEVNEALLDRIKPDTVVVATGSLPLVSHGFIQGLENLELIEPMMADELLEDQRPTGDAVLIIGADQIGLQLADHLSEGGGLVYVVEKSEFLAPQMARADRIFLVKRLAEKDSVKLFRQVEKVDIRPIDEICIVLESGTEQLPNIDTIVFAGARRPNRFPAEMAEKKGIETHIIGDAMGVTEEGQGTVMAAIAAGYDTGRQI